jgi:magnesium transporter
MSRLYAAGLGRKRGQAPGTLVHIGERHSPEATLAIMDYTVSDLRELESLTLEEALSFRASKAVTWLNVTGLSDTSIVGTLCSHFGVHTLVQEDVLHTAQRPKVDIYEDHVFMVVKMIRYDEESRELDIEQVSLVLGDGFVITFQEKEGDVFDSVRQRIRTGKGVVRTLGADYLAYALMDAVVDNYFIALEEMGEDIEEIETAVLDRPEIDVVASIHRLKRELILLRRAVWPLREGFGTLMRDATPLVKPATVPFLRDLHDHAFRVMDTVETFRELVSGLLDVYLSSVSNRMNQVMKVLTIIATIFIPLTFIAGIYGMNFRHMPELAFPWAYPAVLALCLLIALGMIIGFRRKGWF